MTRNSGEGGIRSTLSTQLPLAPHCMSQSPIWQRVATIWIVLVIFGHLALIGVHLSTVLAHRGAHNIGSESANTARQLVSRRRRRDGVGNAPPDVAASYARFSSDLQNTSSILQQQHTCRELAKQNGHRIPSELEFADAAVSGTRRDRDGLNAMMQAAREGRFSTLYFDSLSRLAREFVISMPMLKELVYVHHVRIISVSEHVDSNSDGWELNAMFRSWMHQEFIKGLRAAVLRGQEDLVRNNFSVGDWCFGYGSKPIPGSENSRRGRNARPRMQYVVVKNHADWVKKIFHWFVIDRRPLIWIARELTNHKVPKDHRSTSPGWRHDNVRALLRNTKYIGIWPWGKLTNVRNPINGDLWQEERPIEETIKWVRERPDLRIIDDVLFIKAQAILDENAAKAALVRRDEGKFRGSTVDSANPRHLLQGLVKCGHDGCGATFQVSGSKGRYLACPNYARGLCTCRTRLPRRLAEQMILEAIGQRLLADTGWRNAVFDATRAAWQQRQIDRPDERKNLSDALAKVKLKVEHLMDEIENGNVCPELRERLAQRRNEQNELNRKLAAVPESGAIPSEPPTDEWILSKLKDLHACLRGAGAPAAVALRNLIGTVTVTELSQPSRKRKVLRGEFKLTAASAIRQSGISTEESDCHYQESISLIFSSPLPWVLIADKVKGFFDSGLPYRAIAAELRCPKSWVAKALAYWHRQRGFEQPDGRRCRKRLASQSLAAQLADQAKQLFDEGALFQDIAKALDCNRDTVTAAIRHWFQSRRLPVPDGRTRRKDLAQKVSHRRGLSDEPDNQSQTST